MTRITKLVLVALASCALAYGLIQYADLEPAYAIALAVIAGFIGILLA